MIVVLCGERLSKIVSRQIFTYEEAVDADNIAADQRVSLLQTEPKASSLLAKPRLIGSVPNIIVVARHDPIHRWSELRASDDQLKSWGFRLG